MRVSKRNHEDDPGSDEKPPGERARRLAGALREGGRETRGRLEGRPTDLLSRLWAGLGSVAAIVAAMLLGLWRLAVAAGGSLARGPLAGIGSRLESAVAKLSRVLTPTRVLTAVAIGCALLLALSQFADYRGVAVGSDNYAGVESVAPAPEVDRAEAGSAHSYVFVPVAVLAIVALGLAARSPRWQLCRLAALIGVAAIVVAIVVDRPAGLDEGELTQQFAGVEAKLLGGFWMQIFAGLGLAVTSLLLGSELRRTSRDRLESEPASRRHDRNRRVSAATAGTGPPPREAGA